MFGVDRRESMGGERGSGAVGAPESTKKFGAIKGPIVNEAAFAYYPRLGRVKRFVECHLSDPISLRDAAGIADYERTYFCSWFHRRAGVRFKEWLTLERLKRAAELMRTQDQPIWEIAHCVGFRSLRTFERAFKRRTLISPRAFKTQVRPT
jgi:transcriptional regulator GlxA family with amidase domain